MDLTKKIEIFFKRGNMADMWPTENKMSQLNLIITIVWLYELKQWYTQVIQHIDPFHCTHSDLSKQEKNKYCEKFNSNDTSIYCYHIIRTLTAWWAYMFQYEEVQYDHYQVTKLEVWGKMESDVFHKSAFFIRISACLFFWLPKKLSNLKCAYFKSNAKCSWLINWNLKFSNKCCGI